MGNVKEKWKALGTGTILWLVAEVLGWLLLAKTCLDECGYRFPMVENGPVMWMLIGLSLLLPLVLLILATVFPWKGRKSWGQVLLSLVFSVMVIGTLLAILFFPSVYSFTEDPANFGQYDKRVEDMLLGNPAVGFPREIPPEALDVKYDYFCMNASAEDIYIAVSWRCEDEAAFAQAIVDCPEGGIRVCHQEDGTLAYYYFSTEMKGVSTCFNTVVF